VCRRKQAARVAFPLRTATEIGIGSSSLLRKNKTSLSSSKIETMPTRVQVFIYQFSGKERTIKIERKEFLNPLYKRDKEDELSHISGYMT